MAAGAAVVATGARVGVGAGDSTGGGALGVTGTGPGAGVEHAVSTHRSNSVRGGTKRIGFIASPVNRGGV